MRIAGGKIVSGKVEIDGEPFEDGARVTVIATDDNGTFELTPEQEEALSAAIAEVERGDFVDGAEFLAKLGKRG